MPMAAMLAPMDATSPAPGAAKRLSPWLAVSLLERVEQLTPGATGALLCAAGSELAGTVLLENGRVCWASSARMRRRLTDLLLEQSRPPLDRARLEAVYRRGRDSGEPLGETLVTLGLVTRDGLRSALLRHSAEAMLSIAACDALSFAFVEHRKRRYDATFTFPPAEVLASLGADSRRELADAAREELSRVLGSDGLGAAFSREGETARGLMLAEIGCGPLSCEHVLELGSVTAGTLDLCGAFAPGARLVMSMRSDGSALVCWRVGALELVAVCLDPSSAWCVLAAHARRRG